MGQELSKALEGKVPGRGTPCDVVKYLDLQTISETPEPDYSNKPAPGLGLHHLPMEETVKQEPIILNLIQPKAEPSRMKHSKSQDRNDGEDARKKQASIKMEDTSESDQEESGDVSQVPPQPVCLYYWEVAPRGDPYDIIPPGKRLRLKEANSDKGECQESMSESILLPVRSFRFNGLPYPHEPLFKRRPDLTYDIGVRNSNPMQEPRPGVTIVGQGRGVIMVPGNNEGLPFPEGFPYQFQWPLFNLHHHSHNQPDNN